MTADITLEDKRRAYEMIMKSKIREDKINFSGGCIYFKNGTMSKIELNKKAYKDILDMSEFQNKQMAEDKPVKLGTIYGMPVVINDDLKENEWEIKR